MKIFSLALFLCTAVFCKADGPLSEFKSEKETLFGVIKFEKCNKETITGQSHHYFQHRDGICNIKPEDFARERRIFRNRPCPPSLDFNVESVERYIQTLPENIRETEKKRFEKIREIKPLIIRILARNPYDSKNGVKVKNGNGIRTVSGTISLANEKILIIQKSGSRPERYKWADMAFTQYELFLTFFAEQRLKISCGDMAEKDSKKYAAEDYFRLALLCDWFGKYENALKYAKKSVELYPEMKNPVSEILFK